MNKPISTDFERSRASVLELLVAHTHDVTKKPPDLDYLAAEAFTFIDAGVDTAGRTLAAAVYHVLRNREIEKNLRDELNEANLWCDGTNEADVRKLGKLPYLVSLRVIHQRLQTSLTIFNTECHYQRSTPDLASTPGAIASCGTSRGAASWFLLHPRWCKFFGYLCC
jgi:hypothetical protein